MPERCEVELRPSNPAPDGEHIPEADIVEDEDRAARQLDLGQAIEEQTLETAVFRPVGKDQVGRTKEVCVALHNVRLSDIPNDLRQCSVRKIPLIQADAWKLLPGHDITRY